tara:strand:- start:1951 stop:2547 length:597 start_codon:yes stop_codon:yes gene_type:complete
MDKKVHYTWKDIEHMINVINNLMYADNWRPDYIVGMTRGGLVPAVMMSNITGITMHALDVRFRDTDENYVGPESNSWMAQDAYGYIPEDKRIDIHTGFKVENGPTWDRTRKKNILIIDDINDSGKTLNWIKEDWLKSCMPNDPDWQHVWHNNVRFACLIDNGASNFGDLDYTALEINKEEDPTWIVFPWEGERDYGNF